MNTCRLLFILPFGLLALPSRVLAASLIVDAGQTHTLRADLVLSGADVLEIRGTPEKPCVLRGNRQRIRSTDKWTGAVKITHCTIRELGGLPKRTAENLVKGPGDLACELKVAGKGSIA